MQQNYSWAEVNSHWLELGTQVKLGIACSQSILHFKDVAGWSLWVLLHCLHCGLPWVYWWRTADNMSSTCTGSVVVAHFGLWAWTSDQQPWLALHDDSHPTKVMYSVCRVILKKSPADLKPRIRCKQWSQNCLLALFPNSGLSWHQIFSPIAADNIVHTSNWSCSHFQATHGLNQWSWSALVVHDFQPRWWMQSARWFQMKRLWSWGNRST